MKYTFKVTIIKKITLAIRWCCINNWNSSSILLYFASVLGVSWYGPCVPSQLSSGLSGLKAPPLSSFLFSCYENKIKAVNFIYIHVCTIIITSIIFLLVSDSWGSLYSVYLSNTLSISVLAYWYNLLELLNMIKAISQSHKTLSSYAFFITPNFLLLKVT